MSRTLNDIRDRCRLVDGHWFWAGAKDGGSPKILAPDYTNHGGGMSSQHGRRAVWHVMHKKPIPQGWRVFSTCREKGCLNPDHIACEPTAERGRKVAESGHLRGDMRRIVVTRTASQKRSNLNPELIEIIRTSPKRGREVARELGLREQTVSKVRSGRPLAFDPILSPFAGLGARA